MRHTRPLFVFDWDDVLHNTAEMRSFEASLFKLAGVPEDEVVAAGHRVRLKGPFLLERLIAELGSRRPEVFTAAPALLRVYREAWDRRGSLVFPDAEAFIRKLYGRFPLAILTIGNPESQQRKMYRSGLASLFDHMLFVEDEGGHDTHGRKKAQAIGQLLEMYPSIIYFDDRQDIIAAMHEVHGAHGRLLPFRVERKNQPARYTHIITSFDHPLPPIIERLIAAERASA